MLSQIWQAVSDVPVIVQGGLGSALFALCAWFARYVFRGAIDLRESLLYNRDYHEYYWLSHMHADNPLNVRIFGNSTIIRRALRSLFPTILLLAAALAFDGGPVRSVLIGFAIGSGVDGLRWLRPPRAPTTAEKRANRLAELRGRLGKDHVVVANTPA